MELPYNIAYALSSYALTFVALTLGPPKSGVSKPTADHFPRCRLYKLCIIVWDSGVFFLSNLFMTIDLLRAHASGGL